MLRKLLIIQCGLWYPSISCAMALQAHKNDRITQTDKKIIKIDEFSPKIFLEALTAANQQTITSVLSSFLQLALYCNERLSYKSDDSLAAEKAYFHFNHWFVYYIRGCMYKNELMLSMEKCYATLKEIPNNHGKYITDEYEILAKRHHDTVLKRYRKLQEVHKKIQAAYYYESMSPQQRIDCCTHHEFFLANYEKIEKLYTSVAQLYAEYTLMDRSNLSQYLKEYEAERDRLIPTIHLYTSIEYEQIVWDFLLMQGLVTLATLQHNHQSQSLDVRKKIWSICITFAQFLNDISVYPHDLTIITEPQESDIIQELHTMLRALSTLFENDLLSFPLKPNAADLFLVERQLLSPPIEIQSSPLIKYVPHEWGKNIKENSSTACLYVLPEDSVVDQTCKITLPAEDKPQLATLVVDASADPKRLTPDSSFELPGTASTSEESSHGSE